MEKDTYTTDVIFRRDSNGDIVAIMPELLGTYDRFTCQTYEHIGQHGSGDASLAWSLPLRDCDADNKKALHRELEGIGYNLKEVKRLTKKHLQARIAALKRD